jgi:hypothetical protein
MPYLNESLSFSSIASPEVRHAFFGRVPEAKELLLNHSKLYKWTQYPLVGPKGITAWWSLVDSITLNTGTVVPGLRKVQEWAANLGIHEREYARVRSAVTKQWNTLRKPLFIELIEPVWGWIGKTRGQLEDKDEPKVFLIGGNYQVWLPGLTVNHVKQISALPYLQPK